MVKEVGQPPEHQELTCDELPSCKSIPFEKCAREWGADSSHRLAERLWRLTLLSCCDALGESESLCRLLAWKSLYSLLQTPPTTMNHHSFFESLPCSCADVHLSTRTHAFPFPLPLFRAPPVLIFQYHLCPKPAFPVGNLPGCYAIG